ncbi:MAG: hypothetical protein HOP29_03470 [Phycisphaerales bacterium]|nr:hypothetical protein [Phycisphaerales bacterium]
MSAELSKSQIDGLGKRLRDGTVSEEDSRLLEGFRQSFDSACQNVIGVIQRFEWEDVTSRSKTRRSIEDKLRREPSIRLWQMQDIAGCRLVVTDVLEQDRCAKSITDAFPNAAFIDRRVRPSHGYRAVHIIPKVGRRAVEIQIRTELQHLWAELSERTADKFDPMIKYGEGPTAVRNILRGASYRIFELEVEESYAEAVPPPSMMEESRQILAWARWGQEKQRIADLLRRLISGFDSMKPGAS